MSAIDDELLAGSQQYPEHTANECAEIAAHIASAAVPLVAIGNAIRMHFSRKAAQARVNALLELLMDAVRKQGKELADLQEKINNPEFVETLLVGVDCTLRTSNEKKIERFATILGGELASDQGPNWDEVAALIRDVSELTEDDIRALRVLDSVFRHATFDGPDTWIGISSAYTRQMPELNKAIVAAGFGGDEFFARAARLTGYGLAIEVSVYGNRTFEQDAGYCFRPTGRGRKLIGLLSGNQD